MAVPASTEAPIRAVPPVNEVPRRFSGTNIFLFYYRFQNIYKNNRPPDQLFFTWNKSFFKKIAFSTLYTKQCQFGLATEAQLYKKNHDNPSKNMVNKFKKAKRSIVSESVSDGYIL